MSRIIAGQARSHRDITAFEVGDFPVGAGLPAKASVQTTENHQTARFSFTHDANLSIKPCRNGRVLSFSLPLSSNSVAAPPI